MSVVNQVHPSIHPSIQEEKKRQRVVVLICHRRLRLAAPRLLDPTSSCLTCPPHRRGSTPLQILLPPAKRKGPRHAPPIGNRRPSAQRLETAATTSSSTPAPPCTPRPARICSPIQGRPRKGPSCARASAGSCRSSPWAAYEGRGSWCRRSTTPPTSRAGSPPSSPCASSRGGASPSRLEATLVASRNRAPVPSSGRGDSGKRTASTILITSGSLKAEAFLLVSSETGRNLGPLPWR